MRHVSTRRNTIGRPIHTPVMQKGPSRIGGWQRPSDAPAVPPSVPLHVAEYTEKANMEPPFVLHRVRLDPNLLRSIQIVHIDLVYPA